MWGALGERTPIGHVTNGVHIGTWLDPALGELLRYAGVGPEAPPDEANWDAAREIPSEALWRVHSAAKARLAERAGFDRDLLTIGFARRFATYKRAGLSSPTWSGCWRFRCRSSSPARRTPRTYPGRT